jgi:hypothetical protein
MIVACSPSSVDPNLAPAERVAAYNLDQGGLSAYQKEILEDLTVTQAEYEGAVLAAMDCVEKEFPGATDGPTMRPDGFTLGFAIVGDSGTPEAEERFAAASEREDACSVEFLSSVEAVWWEQHIPAGEERTSMQQAFVDCAAEAGLPGLRVDMPTQELQEKIQEYTNAGDLAVFNCWTRYEIAFSNYAFD